MLCRQLVKAFIATYSPFTQIESKKLDKIQMRRKTQQMKSQIQDMSSMLNRQSQDNVTKTVI